MIEDKTVIDDISFNVKVSFGFASGGSEFKGETVDEYSKSDQDEQIQYRKFNKVAAIL